MTRQKLIQLVHIGANKQFPDDEELRRAWQKERTGHTSCSSMTNADLENLVTELRRKKFLATNRRRYSPKRSGVQSKITAIWIGMGRSKFIDGSEKALGKWCHRMTGKHSIDWLTDKDAIKLLESLKQWRDRLQAEN